MIKKTKKNVLEVGFIKCYIMLSKVNIYVMVNLVFIS